MNCMRKTLVGNCMPLFLALPAGCGLVEFPTCTHPSFEEMETCVKIAEDWRSRIGRVGAEDWYHVKECSILDSDRKPAQVRIEVAASLDAGDCPEFNTALRTAIKAAMDSPASIHATVSTSEVSCWTLDVLGEVASP